jgi:hypothetical protein
MAFNSNIKGYMTFGKSFSRGAAFPLEAYEIWTDYDALVAYAANTDPNKDPSYIGQKVAYVDLENNKVTHYGIEIDGTLKELGAVPVGDGKSISVDANGAISLLGVENADSLTLPRMKEDKSGIEWVPVSAVVEGDGNDNTTYTFTPVTKGEGENAETYGFIVKTFFNGTEVEGGEFTLGFDVYTKSEVDAAIKVVADLVGVPAEGDDSTDTLYERIAAEITRATNAESALSDRIGVAKDGDAAATGVYAYVDGVVNALVNGVDPDKIDSLNELIAWVEAHPDIVSGLDERLGKVEGVLDGFGNEEQPATVKGYIDDTFAAHEGAADGKYATKQEITEAGYLVAADIADKADKATTLAGYGITDAYTKTEIDNKIGTPGVPEIKDGEGNVTQEAVDGTGIFATAYSKAEVNALLDQVSGGSSETAASVKRQLDEYKTSNNQRVSDIETSLSADGATGKAIAAAQSKADAVGIALQSLETGAVAQNTNSIAALNTRVTNAETAIGTNTTEIGALTGKINGLIAEDQAINKAIGEANAAITTEAGARASEDTAIRASLTAVGQQVDGITTKLGTIPENKTVVDLINDAKDAATYDDTAVKKLISDEAARADAEEKRIVGLVEAEATTARAAEQANAKKINEIDATLKAALENDGEGLDSIKELALWIEEHDTEVLPVIAEHTAAIAALQGKVDTGDKTVTGYVDAAIAAIPVATATIAGLVKASGEVTVAEDGTLGIGQVSTDKLVQGNLTLILNGGDAEVSAN